ncbi:MAG: hypothetical protein KAI66_18610, partial [Lentisphaeria bacterium]|nr:hypothetical protein [Lentisphaeria bacterium]
HWPDGSVKWVLVSTVTPSGRTEYTFEYGRRVSTPTVAQPILIAESADALEIDTGRLRARLSKSHFSPPGELWVDGKKVFAGSGEGLTLVDEQGNRFTSSAAAPVRFVIEERGAIRTVVCVEGPLTGPKGKRLSYRCRLYFYRDFPGLPMVVHLLGDEGKTIFPPSMHRIDSFTMPMPLAADSAAGPAQRILHDEDNHYTSTVDGRKTDHAGTHNGVMATQTNGQSVQLVVKDFWRLFPKGLSCDEKMLTAEIFPLLPGDQYADVTDPKQLTINYYWYQKGAYMIPCGTEPSTDFMLYFGAADSATLSESVNATLALAPTPEQMTASGAFWDLEPEREGVFEEYASFVRSGLENIEQRKRSGRWYSWMNYGDTYGERGVNWTNQEYDLQWGMLVQYARNGDLRFLHTAEAHARHTASIDQITWSPTSSHFGIQKEHALWHVGGFGTPRIPGAKYWFQNGIYNTGHMWSQGTYAAYCLTGDRRLKDAIDHLTHWMSTHYTTYLERWVHRNYGWSTLVMLGAYGVEPHPHSLNAARLFMWNVCSKQDPGTGVFIHPIGECTHQPRHMGGKAFMSGVEMTALKYMHQLEGNEAYKTALLKTADWMHTRMWHPGNAGFQYAECTKFDGASSSSGVNMLCEGMAYVYELTRDKRYLEMVAKPLAVNFRKSSASGKGYAMQVRMTPFALSTLERLRVKRLPDVEGPAPKILSGSALHLAPGEPAKLSLTIVHENYEPMRAEIRITSLPKGLQAKPDRVKWKAARGATTSPVITFTGAADAGAAIELECRVGKQVSTRTLRIVHAEQLFLGEGVGIVTAPADPVGLALKALGCQLTPLPDLKPETLARYRSILVGSEAHEKHYAGLPESAARLVDFARSGGRVVFMQFQNTSYQPSFLPLPVGMSDNKGSCAVINKPDHPVFNHPRKIATLKGLVSYDTLTGVDAGWTILATDNRGNPSILETAVGKGRILLVQPSPDRYVLGLEKPFGELRTTTCEALLRNLIAYLQED